ncbi:MAG: response regulator [Steroidobacteraceae bacterium]
MSALPATLVRPTLVIVEDEEVVALSLSESLHEAGFSVQLFSEAERACRAIENAEIAAAIIDVGLPGIGGDELARRWRAERVTLPIILATGYDEHRFAKAAANDPYLGVLGKPFEVTRLVLLLEKLGVHAQTATPLL